MPTYEYQCQSCKQHVEAVQKFTDSPLSTCASCGGELRKVFSAVGIVFKGSGFYKNDSRGNSSSTTPTTTATPTPASTPAPTPAATPSTTTSTTTTSSSANSSND